jgi:hypothetical protein
LGGSIEYRLFPTLTVSQSLQIVADRYSRRTGGQKELIDNDGIADHLHIEGNAAIAGGPRCGFAYDGEYRRQDITGSRRRELVGFARHSLGRTANVRLELRGRQNVDEYPIGLGQEERKERRERLEGGGNVSLEILWPRGVSLSLTAKEQRTSTDFAGQGTSGSGGGDRSTRMRGVDGTAAFEPSDRLELEFSFATEFEAADFTEPDSPDDEEESSRSGLLRAEYRLGENGILTFMRRVSLTSHHFPHAVAAVVRSLDERDVLRGATEARFRLSMAGGTDVAATLAQSSEELIYVRNERSANSRDHDLYQFTSNIEFAPGAGFRIGQAYGLSADYTVYPFDDEKSRLIRTLTVSSNGEIALSDDLTLAVEHRLEREDQGRYSEVGEESRLRYQRDHEVRRHRAGASLEYTLGREIVLTPRVTYLESERFDVWYNIESRSFERLGRDLRREKTYGLTGNYAATTRSDIVFSGTLIERDGERSYWDVDAAFSYAF